MNYNKERSKIIKMVEEKKATATEALEFLYVLNFEESIVRAETKKKSRWLNGKGKTNLEVPFRRADWEFRVFESISRVDR